jgi:hypothetical protein
MVNVQDYTLLHFTDLGEVVTTCDIEQKAIEVLKLRYPGRKFYVKFGSITLLRNCFEVPWSLWFLDE